MTPHERFLRCMHFEPVDHVPLWEWGPWPSTLRRWQREALGDRDNVRQFVDCDPRANTPVDLWMRPRYPEEVLSNDGTYITRRIGRGIVERVPVSPDEMSMPEHIEFPVKTREDWEALKPRFDPDDVARFPENWAERCAGWREREPVTMFHGPRSPSLFGFVRELMGPERTLYAFYDEPELVHDMMETNTEFTIAILKRVLDTAPLTTVFFWEDMCYRGGPLISPAMFTEFMTPRYKRITEVARNAGLDALFVDSDGDVSELIPLWIEAGINGVYPMEVAAGMDVGALRREYGKYLLMTGGIDKRALAKGKDAIDAELKARIPVMEKGGYIPHLDHAIPHDVPYEAFVYYWQRKKELMGIG